MEIRKHYISLEPIERAVSSVGSAANHVLREIDQGIHDDESIEEFHKRVNPEESPTITSVTETVVYAAFREVFDPIHAAMKIVTGETVHGHPVSRVKAGAEIAATVVAKAIKLPKAAKVALTVARIGVEIYKSKK